MEKLWVKDVQIGARASGMFLVARKQQLTGKNGKPFLKVSLQDKTGALDARIWASVEELGALFEVNDLVQVEGPVESFQGHPQLTIEQVGKPDPELLAQFSPNEFVLVSAEAPAGSAGRTGPAAAAGEGAVESIRRELERVQDRHVRALLFSFLDDPEISSRLARAPAAREIHHAYPGGLAEHLLSCVRLAVRLADHFPMADRDLLLAGAFLHDLGKVNEYQLDGGTPDLSDEGKLIGHLVRVAQWIHHKAAAISGFPRDLEHHLVHLVVAHHGSMEAGSPRLPATIEAYLVHQLDEMDSRVNSWLAQMAKGDPASSWTEPRRSWERELWKGPAPTEGGKRHGPPGRAFRGGRGERRKRREVPAARPEGGEAAPVEGGAAVAPAVEGERRPRRERGRDRPPREHRPRTEGERAARPEGERGPRPEGGTRPEGGGPRPDRPPRTDRPARPAGVEKLTFKPFAALAEEEPPAPAASGAAEQPSGAAAAAPASPEPTGQAAPAPEGAGESS